MPRKRVDADLTLSVSFLQDLTRVLLSQVRGRGSQGRRNEIAAQVAAVLREHAELEGTAHLAVAAVVKDVLNADSESTKGVLADFSFDAETGAICWSPRAVAKVLGVSTDVLVGWRFKGTGPEYIKLGDSPQSKTIYRVDKVLAWLAAREKATQEQYPGHAA